MYLKTKRKHETIDKRRRKEPPIWKPPNQIGEPNDECAKDVYKIKYFRIASRNQKNRKTTKPIRKKMEMITHGQRFKDEENQVKTYLGNHLLKEATFEATNTQGSQTYLRRKLSLNTLTEMQKRWKPKERMTHR